MDPQPKPILLSPSLDVKKHTQQEVNQDVENERNPSQTLPNAVDSQAGGETLQKDENVPAPSI